jgi:hypothetical protein
MLTDMHFKSFMTEKEGCQIFLGNISQNRRKYTKLPQKYQMAEKIFQFA